MGDVLVVTGATGFLGSVVTPLLARRGQRVICVIRATSNVQSLAPLGVEVRTADLSDASALADAFVEATVLVNLASLGFGHAPTIVRAARTAGIQRAVFIGTTAVFTSLPARSRRVRLEAESSVRVSGLAYTLLRPTMIYGGVGDRNMARLLRYLARYPVIPVPGSGRALQQPVHVRDVAQAVLAALDRPGTCSRSYNLAGPTPLSFNQIVQTAAAALGRHVVQVHVPLGPIVLALRMAEALRLALPVRPEQVLRLNEDKCVDIQAARQDLDFDPRDFDTGIRELTDALFGKHAA
jgi:nucleoside-diphosphate-sugar epimerase